ncbi:glycosyltransferase family 2 protein [Halopseudomonas sp. Lyrl_26]|uniref:glycosyltransferase family 2 protein n=1 Tax=Halopseudomonas sp. Lyrl_26 TaxID=3110923 RepID=UPI003F7F3F64
MKILSIVIPTYNRAALVEGLLKRLAPAAGRTDLEVVVVDDCSRPSDREELKSIAERYPDFIFLFLSKNTGGAGARNQGATASKAKWIWFLDDDDYIDSEGVCAVCDRLKKLDDNNKMVFLTAKFTNGASVSFRQPSGVEVFKRFARYGNEVNTSCVIFEFSLFDAIGGWDSRLVAGQDTDILLRASEFTDAYVFDDVCVTVVQHDGERITTNPRKQMKAKIQFIFKNYRRLHSVRLLRYIVSLVIAYPYVRRLVKR